MDIDLNTLSVSQMYSHPVPLPGRGVRQKLNTKPSTLDATTQNRIEDNLRTSLRTQQIRLFPTDPDELCTFRIIHDYMHAKGMTFKEVSAWLARRLFEVQPGNSSPGTLLVAKATCNGTEALALMKVDDEKKVTKSEVVTKSETGEEEDISSVLAEMNTLGIDNKVFKAAIFVSAIDENGVPTLEIMASDHQAHGSDGKILADFFLKDFLGCSHAEDPALKLRQFADVCMGLISDIIEDPIEKVRAISGILTTLESSDPTLDIDQTISDWIPVADRDTFSERLNKAGFVATQLEKDTSEIDDAKYISCIMSNGLRIIGPKNQLFDMFRQETDDGLSHIKLEGTILTYKLRKRLS